MKALSRGISFVAVALLIVVGPAFAIPMVVEDVPGNWSVNWYWDAYGSETYNYMQILIASAGDQWGPNAISSNVTGWKGTGWHNSTLATLSGSTATPNLNTFNTDWDGSVQPITTYWQVYNGTTLVDWATGTYTGSGGDQGWYWTNYRGDGGAELNEWGVVSRVPEPISMVMLGCVGAGMFAVRKLRGKRAT